MATQKLKKNLPKRCTNERLKSRRQASWARGQDAKAQRRAAQSGRERANASRTGPTPWEQTKARAKQRRGPVAQSTSERAIIVGRNTSYWLIRRRLDAYLGIGGIDTYYLDTVHQRWTVLGKKMQGGAL